MTRLRLVCREFDGFERSFAHQIEAFQRVYPDVEIRADFLPLEELHRHMLAESGAAWGEADLFLCVTDWLPEAIEGGQILSLDRFLESDPPEGWPEAWSPSMRGLQSRPEGIYGLPYHDGPEVFLYRRDLFEDPAEQDSFRRKSGRELAPPRTWDEFVEVAKFFTRPEQGLWGACLAGYPDAHNNVYDFLIHLWSRGGSLLSAGRSAIRSPEGEEALQFLVDLYHLHRVVDPRCLELDSVASGMHYAQGHAAMMWNWSGFAAVAELPGVSQIVGKNACTLVPGAAGPKGRSVSLNIYWVLTIPSGSRNIDMAYRFLRHVAGPEMDKATSMLGGNGVRLSTWRDTEVREKFPYYAILEEAHRSVESPPQIPEFTAIAECLNRHVDDAMHQRRAVRECIAAASAEIDAILVRQ